MEFARFIAVLGFSVFFASIPIGFFLAVLRWVGLELRVSIWRIMIAVVWGAAGGVALGLLWATGLGRPLMTLYSPGERVLVETVFTVPLAEELAKAVVFVLLLRWRRVGTAVLGLLYGVASGLGFAMTENFAYFLHTYTEAGGQAWFTTVIIRTFFSGILHAATTGAWGAALGHAATHPSAKVRRYLPYGGLATALVLHAGWNLAFVLMGALGWHTPVGVSFMAVPIVVAVLLYVSALAVGRERRIIRLELSAEADQGTLPLDHARIIARLRTRRKAGWLPEGLDHARYVRMALGLALARRRARCQGRDPDGDSAADVIDLRRRLKELRRSAAGAPPEEQPEVDPGLA
jgi:RsiW-degrading membrane proteinase PrsW (M82 family)